MDTSISLAPLEVGDSMRQLHLDELHLQEDALRMFAVVRERHASLQSTLHQMVRRMLLPQACEIGKELARIKGLYESGRKGPGGYASRFYSDCESLTGLKKAQVANYVQLAENWDRLTAFIADLPEGAAPITSMRGAMEAIRAMNHSERPAMAGRADAAGIDIHLLAGEALAAAPGAPGQPDPQSTASPASMRQPISQQNRKNHYSQHRWVESRWLPAAQKLAEARVILRAESVRLGNSYRHREVGGKIFTIPYQRLGAEWAEKGYLASLADALGSEDQSLDGVLLKLKEAGEACAALANGLRMFTGCRPDNNLQDGVR